MSHKLGRVALVALALAPLLSPRAVRAQDPVEFTELDLAVANEAAGTRLVIRVKADSTARIERTGEWNTAKPVEGKITPDELDKVRRAFRGSDMATLPREILSGLADGSKPTRVELQTVKGTERQSVLAVLHYFKDATSGVDYGDRLRPLLEAITEIDVRLSKGHSREVRGSVGITIEPLLFVFRKTTVDVAESLPMVYSEVVIGNDPWKKLLKGESMTTLHLFGKVTDVKNNAGMWRSKIDVEWIKSSAREELQVRASDGTWTTIPKGTVFKTVDVHDDGRTLEIRLADGRKARVDATKVSLGHRLADELPPPSATNGLNGVLTGTVR